ncbi:hemin uptake protein HemP [Dongia sp.]|uniref:hemin uptake protein HemP n=1 Tax=Dongia sp. TaxID=1977262 RepID=UPI0035ADEBB0
MEREIVDFRPISAGMATEHSNDRHDVRERLHLRDAQHGFPRAAVPARQAVQTIPLQAILKGAREAIIDFDGAAYRLRITRNHRLILTK